MPFTDVIIVENAPLGVKAANAAKINCIVALNTSLLTIPDFNCLTASGSLKGVQIKETLTFIGRPTNTSGIIRGIGKGVIMDGESELATVTGEGIGRIDPTGNINWRGSLFFSTSSTDKLAWFSIL